MKTYFRVRWPYWAVLAVIAVWGGVATYRRATRATQILATTTCPLRGEPRVVIAADVAPEDSMPVRVHEEVHAAQCKELGAIRYWVRNLSAAGKLQLEAPAYCAAAVARMRAGMDSARVVSRLLDDVVEAMRDVADSASVIAALRSACPGLRLGG